MKWEITQKHKPKFGDIRFVTNFAWLPTIVLNKKTMTDHKVWLEFYIAEQVYTSGNDGWEYYECWKTVGKTIDK